MTSATSSEAVEAAAAEDLVAIDGNTDRLRLIAQFEATRDARDAAADKLAELRAEIMSQMTTDGDQAWLIGGRVVSRISEVVSTRIDAKALRVESPEVAERFTVVTKSTRLSVTP